MKILALDLGNVWTGSAISDPLKIIAKPYETVKTLELFKFLEKTIKLEKIITIIIGYPKTLNNKESIQTKIVLEQKKEIQAQFKNINIILWDERFSSKRADSLKKTKTKSEIIHKHSIAAAFILNTYLDFLNNN